MKERGLTLIEIVVVMAIAGLLLAVVFAAIAGAQRSRRDNQRKHDLARLSAQLEVYASANSGIYPAVNAGPDGFKGGFLSYLPDSFNDPSIGTPYDLELGFGGSCDSSKAIGSPNGPGSVSYDIPGASGFPYKLRMCLESGEYDIGI
jgi:prepilin-type N-terminal cleavage/methylation domain-containing protein